MNQCVRQKTFPVHKTDTGDAVSLRRLCILLELRLFSEHVAVEKDNMRGGTQRRPAEESGKTVFFRETTGYINLQRFTLKFFVRFWFPRHPHPSTTWKDKYHCMLQKIFIFVRPDTVCGFWGGWGSLRGKEPLFAASKRGSFPLKTKRIRRGVAGPGGLPRPAPARAPAGAGLWQPAWRRRGRRYRPAGRCPGL